MRKEQVIAQRDWQDIFDSIIFFILFWRGGYKSGEQMCKHWEINGIRVCDVLFPKNQFLKFMSKKKPKEFLVDEHMDFFFRHLLLECCSIFVHIS